MNNSSFSKNNNKNQRLGFSISLTHKKKKQAAATMAEKVEISAATFNNNQQNDARKVRKSPDFQPIMPGVISRERSFVRTSNQQVSPQAHTHT